MGTVVMGKVESGSVCEGDSLLVMPNKVLSLAYFSICLIIIITIICLYAKYINIVDGG